ncbi:MAG: OmpH family outer membrane protein [Synergistaceae bacterium]|nr:OmpH family outer membrane protein [Synergistaceae bacterium]
MKKLVVLLVAAIAIFSLNAVAFAAEEKVGFVDEMAVLQQFPKFKQAQQQIDAIGKKKSEAAKTAFDKETDEKKKANIVQTLQLEMREEESKLMNPILKEINETIAKVAKTKGITIVLNKGLVYYGGIDITNDVVTALKR